MPVSREVAESVCLRRSFRPRRRPSLSRNHPTRRNNLATAYQDAGRLPDAIPLLERTLTDRERVLGPDHPDTLGSRNNLAGAYHAAGRLNDALPLLERTFTDSERVLGPDHPTTVTVRANLARLRAEVSQDRG